VQGDKATLEELEERIRAATESAKARKTRREVRTPASKLFHSGSSHSLQLSKSLVYYVQPLPMSNHLSSPPAYSTLPFLG
jgi:hypothetical protein